MQLKGQTNSPIYSNDRRLKEEVSYGSNKSNLNGYLSQNLEGRSGTGNKDHRIQRRRAKQHRWLTRSSTKVFSLRREGGMSMLSRNVLFVNIVIDIE